MEHIANTPQRIDFDAHDHAMALPIATVIRQLVDPHCATTVAMLGGVTATRAVAQWMTDREPKRANEMRLALRIATMIAAQGDRERARASFYGPNPRLGDGLPMLVLRNGPFHETQVPLVAAARAFASRA